MPAVIPAKGIFQKSQGTKVRPSIAPTTVIPAQAGIQKAYPGAQTSYWIPAFAGMTSGAWHLHSMDVS